MSIGHLDMSLVQWTKRDTRISRKLELGRYLQSIGLSIGPWITPKFKELLIRHRQNAFISGDTVRFRKFQNLINRERKILCKKFFTLKVSQLKQVNPSQWWDAVKRISGMSSLSGSQDLTSQ